MIASVSLRDISQQALARMRARRSAARAALDYFWRAMSSPINTPCGFCGLEYYFLFLLALFRSIARELLKVLPACIHPLLCLLEQLFCCLRLALSKHSKAVL